MHDHGNLMSCDTDNRIAYGLSKKLEGLSNVRVGPLIPFGYTKQGLIDFKLETIEKILEDYLNSFKLKGINEFYVISAHSENREPLENLIKTKRYDISLLEWWKEKHVKELITEDNGKMDKYVIYDEALLLNRLFGDKIDNKDKIIYKLKERAVKLRLNINSNIELIEKLGDFYLDKILNCFYSKLENGTKNCSMSN